MSSFISFDQRRLDEPQEVIDDLLRQIARQAADIHQKNERLGLSVNDGVEPGAHESPTSKSPKSKKAAKKDNDVIRDEPP